METDQSYAILHILYPYLVVDREGRGGDIVCGEGEVFAGVAAAHPVALPVRRDAAR